MSAAAEQQIRAADPGRSTWLSANAGSGKTRVLTDRVARLLLNGVPPQNILCLTYTKAAAGEMQNRLFRRLGSWAMLDDAALGAQLAAIGEAGPIGADRLARARRLFASAVETPGGLKIQTIHSFCAAILRQFPLEAGVSPGFREIDERESKLILRELFDALAEGPEAHHLADFARHTTTGALAGLLQEIARHAAAFEPPASDAEVLGWFGFDGSETPATIRAEALARDGALGDLLAVFAAGPATLKKKAEALAGYRTWPDEQRFTALAAELFTKDGTPVKLMLTHLGKNPDVEADCLALVEAVLAAKTRLGDLAEAGRSLALHRFARVYTRAYAQRKAAAGLLDFDDLIRRTLALLNNPAVCDWVLFRLDGGIDHILVDEAQDTSPPQWAIIERLAQEFSSGEGARSGTARTIFAVGDQKQSIYSFQGADPAEFERMRRHFDARLAGATPPFQSLGLRHSFRASPLLLRLVDAVFGDLPLGVADPALHLAFHAALPGRIDLWPLLAQDDADPLPEWHDAADRTAPRDATLVLADRIAAEVARMVAEEHLWDEDGNRRRLHAGDVMILVRRRSFITDPLILALKRVGLEVAGSDQIVLASELAVMDIVAVLNFLATPADDLSLAAALRSPLFGLSEAELYTLAHGRDGSLWDALAASADRHPKAVAVLNDLRRQADYLRPFELIARLLIRHEGRRRLVGRLGEEIGEAVDVLLQQALAYEASEVPSLKGFLTWHAADGVKVKRQAESSGDRLRVMTVHGAKGLESPVVILPDTADLQLRNRAALIRLENGQPVFRSAKDAVPAAFAAVYANEAAREQEESNRLLYVALTRAKHWLIVCGAGKDSASDARTPCWHRLVGTALARLDPVATLIGGAPALRAEMGDWPPPARAVAAPAPGAGPDEAPPLPGWAERAADPGPPLPVLLSPSTLGPMAQGGAAIAVEGEDALLRGSRLHLLLEHLPRHPPAQWPEAAAAILRNGDDPPADSDIPALLAEAAAVLENAALGWLFGDDSLAEVDITAALPELGGARIRGRIDRLVRRPGRVLAVDFKSNREVPDNPAEIPEGILMQLGAYASALAQIFPGEAVEVAVLWTRTARLMPVPCDIVTGALARAARS